MTPVQILVVEDNATTLKMMRLALQAEGYAVLEAADGATALRLVSEHSPALVLLDCKLPDMDGFELARRLRAMTPTLPVVAVTGWAQTDEVLTAGFVEVMVKPAEVSRLIEIVERYVGRPTPKPTHAGKTVLIADDDPMQCKLAQLAFSGAGFVVVLAEDGDAAFRLAVARPPDAIVSDVLMPRMDGFALCRAVRAEPLLAGVPVVLTSTHYVQDADRDLATQLGASRYVSRTDGFGAVLRAVTEVIDAPAAEGGASFDADLEAEHLRRISHQLERQANISVGFARRVSLQASALSVLQGLSDSLAREHDPESALGDTLEKFLDAAGMSVGAILLRGEDGRLAIRAQVGSSVELDWGKYSALLLQAISQGCLMVPSAEAGQAGAALLVGLGAVSALIVPIVARDLSLGALLLASNGTDLAGAEGASALRAARSVALQLGQALALSRMFSKLASAEQRYRALFENARDGIGVSTLDGVVLEMNRGFEKMLGQSRSEVVGHRLADFFPEVSKEDLNSDGPLSVSSGRGSSATRIQQANGTETFAEISRTVVEIGGESFVLSIGRDVTERIRLEDQLRQSQKMDAIGRLAGGVAHDFNNLLSVILSYGEMLLSELKPGEPMRADIEEIRNAGKRAAELTRQLLMFSRQQVVEPRVLDLNEVLTGVNNMLQRILGADVDLVVSRAPELARVRVDPGSMEQVIMNLVINARDAMPTGGKLTLETANVVLDEEFTRGHHGVKPGPHVMLAVTDTGVGMDKATQTRIFEPFYTTKGVGQGTGLGLSTVFGIVQQSGGSVWVYSEPRRGTSFKVYLPVVDAEVDGVRPVQTATDLRGTETVLLVEDDDQVRLVARGILRKSGYQVLEARDAGEALQHSETHDGVIHLLLTDVVLPLVSGPELAKRLILLRPEMRVLCMSGYTDDSIVRHGVLPSDVAYVQKPLTPARLTARVREVLDATSHDTAKEQTT